jgi:hypothetical protein
LSSISLALQIASIILAAWYASPIKSLSLNLRYHRIYKKRRKRKERVIKMIQTKSWKITDEFWEEVKDLIPEKQRDPNKEYK